MKKFLLQMLSATAGIFLAISLVVIIGTVVLISSVDTSTPSVGNHSLLKIELNGPLEERGTSNPMADVIGGAASSLGLDEMLRAIKTAKTDDRIKAIYLKAGALSASPATLQELRQALTDFRESGKPIVSYGDDYTQGCYYVCSAANRIIMNPIGSVDWKGLASQPMFLKDVLQKFGVKMQIFKVGTFKSAVEPYTNTSMSDANRAQVTSYLGAIWSQMIGDVAKSRGISTTQLQALADSGTVFMRAQMVKNQKLVDDLKYEKEVEKYLCKLVGVKSVKKMDVLSASDVCAIEKDEKSSSNKVAIYYAFGDVVSKSKKSLKSGSAISAAEMVDDLADLAEDDKVKAVVLRINSGGGSAYASEQIWKAMKDLSAKKPVVISMGGMAASGAYYISCGTDYIVAEPTTLTGSIGIFGMFPDVSNLLTEKLGLKFDMVKTGRHADFGTMSRPLNQEEQSLLQAQIQDGYDLFLKRVSEGRKISADSINKIAQGRVWTGSQAQKIGLVDELGNLDAAVARAAARAKLTHDDYQLAYYPAQKKWYEQLLEQKMDGLMNAKLQSEWGEYYKPFIWLKTLKQRDYIQARLPYDPNIY